MEQAELQQQLNNAVAGVSAWGNRQELLTADQTALFRQLLPDAIEHAAEATPDGTIFIKTGDILAMWQRDTVFQMLPYVALIDEVPALRDVLLGVLERLLQNTVRDPYANAFNLNDNGLHWAADESNEPISDWVWERKFELDSLIAPLFFAVKLAEVLNPDEVFNAQFWAAYDVVLETLETEQQHATSPYYFIRRNDWANDQLPGGEGRGGAVKANGLVWNGFRPSDDASQYGYHIPDNCFAVAVLQALAPHIASDEQERAARTERLIASITKGLEEAVVTLPSGERGFAYEIDGLGNTVLMDDANVPSLLSLPFLTGHTPDDPHYQATRRFILSADNPYYYAGATLKGIGSPHTPPRHVWAISLLMEGITSSDRAVKERQLELVTQFARETGQCHESVSVDDPSQRTREWFSWANMTYCQLALQLLGKA